MRRVRSWRWLKVRIRGLLAVPPALVVTPDGRMLRVQQTRIGLALEPPDLAPRTQAGPVDSDSD